MSPLVAAAPPEQTAKAPKVEFTAAMEARLSERWGADEDGRFPCPIPGHAGAATLIENDRCELALACCKGGRWRSLGEVHAAISYGHDVKLKNRELAVWTRLLAWEIEGFEPAPVALPAPCPGPPYLTRAALGFALLCGLRWGDYKREPVAFSVRFASVWCGLSHWQASTAIRVLQAEGVLRAVASVVHQPRPFSLFEPGPIRPDGEVLTVPTLSEWKEQQ